MSRSCPSLPFCTETMIKHPYAYNDPHTCCEAPAYIYANLVSPTYPCVSRFGMSIMIHTPCRPHSVLQIMIYLHGIRTRIWKVSFPWVFSDSHLGPSQLPTLPVILQTISAESLPWRQLGEEKLAGVVRLSRRRSVAVSISYRSNRFTL
jgi:hypothetical protein